MKAILLCLLLSLAACSHWAVLVAGSNTYSNYRHQSDIFHAYQVLVKEGFDQDKIITFAYDDIANNINNPFPGKVFNKPTYNNPGVDVYEGVKIDYSKANVTPANFLAVLEGDKAAVKGKGTERVLESTSADNVFIYFADHGAPGLIAFPSSRLYAKDLMETFSKMTNKKNYKKMVFYLEVLNLLYRLVNQVQCSKIFPTIPEFMAFPLPTQPNPHGAATALLTMSSMANTSNPALEISSQSTLSKTPKREIWTKP